MNGPNGEAQDRRTWTAGERLVKLETELRHLREDQHEYVRRGEFRPVQLIAFGLVALVCAGVIGALLSTVFAGGAP